MRCCPIFFFGFIEILQFNNFGLVGFIQFILVHIDDGSIDSRRGERWHRVNEFEVCMNFEFPPATGWWIASYEKRQEIKLDLVLHQLQHIKSS